MGTENKKQKLVSASDDNIIIRVPKYKKKKFKERCKEKDTTMSKALNKSIDEILAR